MSETYTVVQGDHLSRVAAQFGFADYLTIWDHASNASLKKARDNPNVLLPGDRLFIPDLEPKRETVATGKTHPFQLRIETLMLRIGLEDVLFKPLANVKCELTIDGQLFSLLTNAKGQFEHVLLPTAEKAELRIRDGATRTDDLLIPVRIGHLNPIESVTGQKARLNNLGYFAGAVDKDDERLFRSAVEEFQCDQLGHAAVDGKCGPKTQAKLKAMHGC